MHFRFGNGQNVRQNVQTPPQGIVNILIQTGPYFPQPSPAFAKFMASSPIGVKRAHHVGMGQNKQTRRPQVSSIYQGKPFGVPIFDPQPCKVLQLGIFHFRSWTY